MLAALCCRPRGKALPENALHPAVPENPVLSMCRNPQAQCFQGSPGNRVVSGTYFQGPREIRFSETHGIRRYTKVTMDPVVFGNEKKRVTRVLHKSSDVSCRFSNVTRVTRFFRSLYKINFLIHGANMRSGTPCFFPRE